MADIDIDPFGEHQSRPEEPTNENIPSDPVTPGRSSTWEPEREQETSFGGRSRTSILHKEYLVGKIYELIGNKMHQRLEPNLSLFVLGELKTTGVIADTLGIGGLREMGYNISNTNLKPRFVLDLMENKPNCPPSMK